MTQSAVWRERTRSVASDADGDRDVRDALRLFQGRRRSEGVVVLGARAAMVYGALTRAMGKGVPWVAKEVFLDAGGASPRRGLKRAVQRWAFAGCDACIVYARAEQELCADELGLPPGRCEFVPFHTRIQPVDRPVEGDGPLLAAGRSLRDYPTLAAAALQHGGPLDVVAPESARRHFAGNTRVNFLGELVPEEYSRRLRACRAVVVTLERGIRSAGQAVVLEAMALGKPALVSRSAGIVDYAEADATCLMHEAGDSASLARDMAGLDGDPGLRRRLGEAALARSRNFTPDAHARAVLAILDRAR